MTDGKRGVRCRYQGSIAAGSIILDVLSQGLFDSRSKNRLRHDGCVRLQLVYPPHCCLRHHDTSKAI
jgi:hypothetical protein